MKRIISRGLCCFLVFCIVFSAAFSLVSATTVGVVASANIMSNPSFENNETWKLKESLFNISDNVAHSGSYSLALTAGENKWTGWAQNQCITVEPNTSYIFSFWVNTKNGYYIKLQNYYSGETSFSQEVKNETLNTNGNWKQISVDVNIKNITALNVAVGNAYSRTDESYFDDFSIVKKDASKLCNGGFEDSLYYWQFTGPSFTLEKEKVHSGSHALCRAATAAWGDWAYSNYISVPNNKEYTLTFWVNTSTGCYITVKNFINGDTLGKIDDAALNTNGGWQKKEIDFNSGSATLIKIEIGNSANMSAAVYYDDFSIEEATAEGGNIGGGSDESPDEDSDNTPSDTGNIIINPGFETSGTWRLADSLFSISNITSHSGNYSLALSAGENKWTGWAQNQCIAVEPNTNYIFSFWVNTKNGYYIKIQNYYSSETSFSQEVKNETLNTNGNWKQICVDVNVKNITALNVVVGNAYARTDVSYFDDFSIVKRDTLKLSNGNFEDNLYHWQFTGYSCSLEEENVHSGSYALCRQGTAAWADFAYSNYISVPQNIDYSFSFYVKTSKGYSVSVIDFVTGKRIVHLNDTALNTNGNWELVTAKFNTGNYKLIRIEISSSIATTTPTYFDDFVLKEYVSYGWLLPKNGGKQDCDDDDNLIANSDCDKPEYWALNSEGYGSAVTVTDEGTLKVSGGVYTKFFDVEPDTNYCLAYKGIADLSQLADVVFEIVDQEGVPFELKGTSKYFMPTIRLTGQDGFWHRGTIFICTDKAEKIGLRLTAKSGTIYLDDIALFKESDNKGIEAKRVNSAKVSWSDNELFACKDSDNLFPEIASLNANSDWTDTEGFNEFIGTDIYAKEDVLHYQSYKTNDNHYFFGEIPIEPDTDYAFSIYFKILQEGEATFGLVDDNGAFTDIDAQFSLSDETTEDGWGFYTLNFRSGESKNICFAVYDGGGEALFAKPRLFKLENAIAVPENDMPDVEINKDDLEELPNLGSDGNAVENETLDQEEEEESFENSDSNEKPTNNPKGDSKSEKSSSNISLSIKIFAVVLLVAGLFVATVFYVKRRRASKNRKS